MTCKEEGCEMKHHAKGLCKFHYHRKWREGRYKYKGEKGEHCIVPECTNLRQIGNLCRRHHDMVPKKARVVRTCEIDGCNRKHKAHGLCVTHYKRKYMNQDMNAPVKDRNVPSKCTIENCDNDHHSSGYCSFHYSRYKRGLRGEELTKPRNKKKMRVQLSDEVLSALVHSYIWKVLPVKKEIYDELRELRYLEFNGELTQMGKQYVANKYDGKECILDNCEGKRGRSVFCKKHFNRFVSDKLRGQELIDSQGRLKDDLLDFVTFVFRNENDKWLKVTKGNKSLVIRGIRLGYFKLNSARTGIRTTPKVFNLAELE